MKIAISGFKGMIPGIHARALPEDHGVIAESVRLDDGTLTPIRGERRVFTFDSDVRSFIRHPSGDWMGFTTVVKAANGAVDATRVYVTGNGEPKVFTSSTESMNLRLDPPTTRPRARIISGVVDQDIATESVYVYTFITELGEESAPSRLSNRIKWSPGVQIEIYGLPAASPNPERGLTGMRLYRSITDALGATTLYFLDEVGFSSTYVDDTDESSEVTGEPIPSTDYDRPPVGMQGITSMPNGMMAAFRGRELMFCEPYIHHAWPIKYRLRVDYPIVGLGAFGSSIVILTEGMPYVAQGTHPDSMVMEKIEMDLPCVAARGIVDMGYAVIYPSTDGLVQVGNGGAQMISGPLFKREVWASMRPETFIASKANGRYVFSYLPQAARDEDETKMVRRLGMIDTSGVQPFFITDDAQFTHMEHEIKTGHLFGLFEGRGVVRWDDLTQPYKRMRWRSKEIHLPTPTNFGAIRVDGDDDPNSDLYCRVFCGKGARLVREIRGRNKVERLPSGFTEEVWQIEIEGFMPITAVFLAHAPSELAKG